MSGGSIGGGAAQDAASSFGAQSPSVIPAQGTGAALSPMQTFLSRLGKINTPGGAGGSQSPLVGQGAQLMGAGQPQGGMARPPMPMQHPQMGGAGGLPQMPAPPVQQSGINPQMVNQALARRTGLFGGGNF